jgi:hypothetical protein
LAVREKEALAESFTLSYRLQPQIHGISLSTNASAPLSSSKKRKNLNTILVGPLGKNQRHPYALNNKERDHPV